MKKLSLIIILLLLLVSCHNVQESDDSSKNSYISTEKNNKVATLRDNLGPYTGWFYVNLT